MCVLVPSAALNWLEYIRFFCTIFQCLQGRTKSNEFKLKEGKNRLNIRKKFFSVSEGDKTLAQAT